MRTIKLLGFNFLCFILLVSCTDTDAITNVISTQPDGVEAFEALNVSYGPHPRQVLDIYLPARRTAKTKTVILLHGGGWTQGDKSSMTPIGMLIRNDIPDLAVVNMNYRLADDTNAPFPMQIEDITAAVAFLSNNSAKYLISNTVGFIGTSAGANLALLWSYAFDSNSATNMVCSIVGPTNFTDPAYTDNANTTMALFTSAFGTEATTTFLETISPLHNVTASAPPSILFYGAQDALIPITQGVDLKNKLQTLGIPHEFTLYENEGHGWTGLALLDTWTKLKAFMAIHL